MIGKRLAVLLSLSVLTPVAALAQEAAVPAAPAAAPSESAMVNLVRALIKQKALRPDVGAALIQQAEAEAALARDAAAAAKYGARFPRLNLVTIDGDFGGWGKAQKKHFDDGGIFDQIYQGK